MSRLIIALVIFSMLLTVSISSVIYISNSEEKLESELTEIIDTLSQENFEKAHTLSLQFEKDWDRIEPFIIMLIRHNSVDEITRHISRLTAYCENDCKADAVAEAQLIKVILRHMSDDEKPKLHNFF